ncbi:GNAT family N-acetyltransferase [Rhodococcus sp. SMB37]|uniref:GNAT family N-acetyltransferase n=1 Tax=Rhodococcus sp. SMB37 TaxID=2512213 RepID=UPI001050D809|nr:GNAT family N-acetyltransferase [Rhodococcus sp. SMB37]
MADIEVRVLGEADWQVYRDLRLAALRESPGAVVAADEEQSRDDEQGWRERMRSIRLLVADRAGEAVGIIGLGVHARDEQAGEILGVWVAPQARRSRVAWDLVRAGAEHSRAQGHRRLYFWVGSDNGSAVAFASAFGFRPTSDRRPARGTDAGDSPGEVAMVLSLSVDPGNPRLP